MTSLQKNGRYFKWTVECRLRFEQSKHLLTSSPILKVVDPEMDFTVYTDACQQGVGGVLMKDGKVVAYELRKLKEHEQQYSIYDLDLIVVVHALKV